MTSTLTQRAQLWERVRECRPDNFAETALAVFRYQARENPVYGDFLRLLGVDYRAVTTLEAIPFLPIQFFKRFDLKTGKWPTEQVFTSSGTSGPDTARHHLRDAAAYRYNARRGFAAFYGSPADYCFLALLPAYLERQGSSLIFMADDFIRRSRFAESNFFLYNRDALLKILRKCKKENIPTVLLGVSFALLDLAETYPTDLSGLIVMETGGMKGRRRELTRQELHRKLKTAFNLEAVHSEYGMTELFSQAYSPGEGLFYPAPTMRVLCREVTDPLQAQRPGRAGGLNIIDLANLDTISFIATDDLGRVHPGGAFEVLGRLDASDVRGCNLLVS